MSDVLQDKPLELWQLQPLESASPAESRLAATGRAVGHALRSVSLALLGHHSPSAEAGVTSATANRRGPRSESNGYTVEMPDSWFPRSVLESAVLVEATPVESMEQAG